MDFADRLLEAQRAKSSLAMLGVDPQLDIPLPPGYALSHFCCEIVEACAPYVAAIKPQLAFFEARGLEGMAALAEIIKFARRLELLVIADAKRGDIGSTSAAYAEAFLGDGDFACDAVTVNPWLGSDGVMPFVARVRSGKGLFVLVKTSNPSSGEFQDLGGADGAVWQAVARRVNGWGGDFVGRSGFSSVGAVVGATYPAIAVKARDLMPQAIMLVPGYGAQGAGAADAVAGSRADGAGIIVNSSRLLMYAYQSAPGGGPGQAAQAAALKMRDQLNAAIAARPK